MLSLGASWIAVGVVAVFALLMNIPLLRRSLLTCPVYSLIRRMCAFPRISETERVALEAGDVWIEKDLFGGMPNVAQLRSLPYPGLSVRERQFLDGQVERALQAGSRTGSSGRQRDLPAAAWDYIRSERSSSG